jgi:4-amino-4-deoxy-L-arabinose transferase-like glycosyltransferase
LTADTAEGRPQAPPPTETASWFWPWLGVVVLLGLAWRIFYVTVIGTPDGTGGDPFYYHAQANLLANGHGFADPFGWQLNHDLIRPTAQHPPLYTLALALVSLFGGESYMAHKIASCFIGAGTILVIGLVGRRVGGPRAGVIAGVIAAAYPNLWLVDGVVLSEDLFALTIGLTILAAYRFRDRPDILSAGFVGGSIALAALVRGEAVMLGVFLAIPLMLLTKTIPFSRRAVLLVIAGVACVIVLAPWVYRNMTAFEEPVVLSTNSYGVLAVANCDETYSGELMGFWYFNCDPGSKGDESQRAIASRDRGLRYIENHKERFPVAVAARLGRVWEVFRPWQNASYTQFEGRPLWGSRAGLFSYYALALLAIPGFWLVRRRGLTLIPLLSQIVLVCAIVVYAYGSVRFRLPAEVVIVALAALTIDTGIRWFANRRTDPASGGLEPAESGRVG